MAEDKKNGMMHGAGCMCSGCGMKMGMGASMGGWGRHWTFYLIRVLLTILILMVVFWFGVAVGRLSSGIARDRYMGENSGAYPMMGDMMPGNATSSK